MLTKANLRIRLRIEILDEVEQNRWGAYSADSLPKRLSVDGIERRFEVNVGYIQGLAKFAVQVGQQVQARIASIIERPAVKPDCCGRRRSASNGSRRSS